MHAWNYVFSCWKNLKSIVQLPRVVDREFDKIESETIFRYERPLWLTYSSHTLSVASNAVLVWIRTKLDWNLNVIPSALHITDQLSRSCNVYFSLRPSRMRRVAASQESLDEWGTTTQPLFPETAGPIVDVAAVLVNAPLWSFMICNCRVRLRHSFTKDS